MPEYPILSLFKGMRPERVTSVGFTVNMRGNTRVWTGQDAQRALALVQTLQGPTVDRDNVSMHSWDWDRMKSNPRYDPPWFSVRAIEHWQTEGLPVENEIHTSVWFWDLGETEDGTDEGVPVVSVREFHASPNPREILPSHENYFTLYRHDVQPIFDTLLSTPSTTYPLAQILEMLVTYVRAFVRA